MVVAFVAVAVVALLGIAGLAPSTLAGASHGGPAAILHAGVLSPTSATAGHVFGEQTLGAGAGELTPAYVPAAHELFVPDSSVGEVTVVNTTTNQRVAVNTNVSIPEGVAYVPSLNRVYVSDAGFGTVDIINPSLPTQVTFFPTLPPGGGIIGYDPTSSLLWVADDFGNLWTVDPLSGGYQLIADIPGATYTSLAYDNAADFMFITYTTAVGSYLLAYDDASGILVADASVTSDPIAVALDPAADLLVTDNGTGLTYFDPTSQTDFGIGAPVFTLPLLPALPDLAALAYDPILQVMLVAQDEGPTGGQLLTASATGTVPFLTSQISVGPKPDGVVFDPDNDNLYVAGSSSLTILGAASFTIQAQSSVPTFERICCEQGIVYVPTTKSLWVMSADPSASPVGIYAAGGHHALLHTVHAGPYAEAILYDPLTNAVVVWNAGNNTISVFNVNTYAVVTHPVPGTGYSMAYDPSHETIGLSDYGQGNFTVLSARNYSVLANIPIGPEPTGIAYDPFLTAFVVANGAANNVSVIQGTTHLYNRSVSWYCSDCEMSGILYDPATGDLVVQWAYAAGVAILNGHSLSVIRWVATSVDGVFGNNQAWTTMAYDPEDHDVFVFGFNYTADLGGEPAATAILNSRGELLDLSTQGATTDWPQSAVYDPVTGQVAAPSYSELSFFDS